MNKSTTHSRIISGQTIDDYPTKYPRHPVFRQQLTFGQRAADAIARFAGSWKFIISLWVVLLSWIVLNMVFLQNQGFDPYPFILMNLILSTLAAFQAPVIIMTQNRQVERDRLDARYDHAVNRKAEREIQQLQSQVRALQAELSRVKKKE